jgi:DNA ligase-1
MLSHEIYDLIEAIAATSSKLEKESLLRAHGADEDLRAVLVHALDNTISFGMKKIPERDGAASRDEAFDAQTWDLLQRLRSRALTGHAARDTVQAEVNRLDAKSAELLRRIIRQDLRAGFSSSTANKAIKGLIKEFPYMRCSLPAKSNIKTFDWARGVFSQIKADGMFVNVTYRASDDAEVSLRTRQGNELPLNELGALVEDIAALLVPDHGYQGELVVYEDGVLLPRKVGNGVLNSVLKGGRLAPNQRVVFEVWDRVPLSALVPDSEHDEEYGSRHAHLSAMLEGFEETGVRLIETRIVHSFAEAVEHCRDALRRGLEGTIIKSITATWKDGTSKDQVKLKIEAPCDLEIVTVLAGEAGRRNEHRPGSLRCATVDRRLVVDITIKDEKMRAAVEADPDSFVGGIIEVLFNDIMEPGKSNDLHSLYLPRFKNAFARVDKDTADTLERVYEQFEEAKNLEWVLAEQQN